MKKAIKRERKNSNYRQHLTNWELVAEETNPQVKDLIKKISWKGKFISKKGERFKLTTKQSLETQIRQTVESPIWRRLLTLI